MSCTIHVAVTTRFQQLALGWVSAGALLVAAASQSPPDSAAAWSAASQSASIDRMTAERIARLTRDHVVSRTMWRPAETAALELVVLAAEQETAQPLVDAAHQALQRFGDWLGPPRISRLTIVELPGHLDLAEAAYPGVAAMRVRWWTGRREFAVERDMAAAIARQYAVTLAAADPSSAWFAEGLAAYLATRPMELRFDPRPALTPRYFGGFVPHSIRAISTRLTDPRPNLFDLAAFLDAGDAPWQLTRGEDRERARRFATALHSLERLIGWPSLQAGLHAFMQREGGAPLLERFTGVISAQRGSDMRWFFDQSMRMDARLDYAIAGITSAAAPAGRWQTTVDVRRLGEASFDGTSRPRAESTARSLPVVTTFADGTEITEWIDGRDRDWRFQYSSASPATRASVDADAILLLDADRTNNSRAVNPRLSETGLRLAINWLTWLQDAMLACTAVV
jgi:hypothetical protein